jgi:hypothetical protein
MDLNELLYRQQISLMRAASAACSEARLAHRALARGYAERIARLCGALRIATLPVTAA